MQKIKRYLITSMAVNVQERKKKNGKVYDAVFRIIEAHTGIEKQKRLSGYQTKTLAKQAHAEFVKDQCELVKGNPFKSKRNTEKQAPLIKDLITEYIGSLQNQNKYSSIYDKQSVFNNHIIPSLGERKITELTTDVLYKWQDELWSKPNPQREGYYSYARLKHIRAVLSSFLNWVKDRYKYDNNLSNVKIPKRRESEPKSTRSNFWTEEQFKQFISVVDDQMYYAFFSLLFYTGKRVGEVTALSPKDYKGTHLIINKSITAKTTNGQPWQVTTTKAYKNDLLPLSPAAQSILKQYMQTEYYDPNSDFIFGKSRPLPHESIRMKLKGYIKKSNLPPITVHGFRHSFVSMIIHHGANFSVVADLINDNLEQVTKTYAHMYDIDKVAVLNSIVLK